MRRNGWRLTDELTNEVYEGEDADDLRDTLESVFDMSNEPVRLAVDDMVAEWKRNEVWADTEACLAVRLEAR